MATKAAGNAVDKEYARIKKKHFDYEDKEYNQAKDSLEAEKKRLRDVDKDIKNINRNKKMLYLCKLIYYMLIWLTVTLRKN